MGGVNVGGAVGVILTVFAAKLCAPPTPEKDKDGFHSIHW